MEVEEGVSGDGNPTFTVRAAPDGLTVDLPAEMQQRGWFAVPPAPNKVADVGWQKGCAVRCVVNPTYSFWYAYVYLFGKKRRKKLGIYHAWAGM